MTQRNYALINGLKLSSTELHPNRDLRLKVRISRLRNEHKPSKDKNQKGDLLCVSMVLIDEEGNYIYAFIPSFNWERFSPKVCDGKIYLIKRFQVLQNKPDYRVVGDNKLMIKFLYNTYIKAFEADEAIIPKHRFDFLKFHHISQRKGNNSVLTDLIGVVKQEHVKANYFALEIEDEGGERVRVTLWDQCRSDYQEQKEKLADCTQTKVVIITSLTVKDYNGYNSIATSTSSCIYINLDVPEVNALKENLSTNSGESVVEYITNDIVRKDISGILMHCNTDYKEDLVCYCTAEVKDIISENPWHYPSCIKCTTRSQFKNPKFYSNNCEKLMETQTIRYRIELQVQDSKSTTTFVIFDKDSKRLIGQDASTLSDAQQLEEEDNEDYIPLPTLMKNTFIGKQFQFKIKVVKTNHGKTHDNSFNVISILDEAVTKEGSSSAISTIGEKRTHSVIDLEASSTQQEAKTKKKCNYTMTPKK